MTTANSSDQSSPELQKSAGPSCAVASGSPLSDKTKPEKINVRLFDLVRYMRSELHRADLITCDEYVWLCQKTFPGDPAQGSPSPRRLEDYDEIRAKLKAFEQANIADLPTSRP